MSALNRVFNSLMDGPEIDFTDKDLDEAIVEQIKKVLTFIVNMNEHLTTSVTVLCILEFAKAKNIIAIDELKQFGISNEVNRKYYDQCLRKAYPIAVSIFTEKIAKKIKK